MDGLAAAAAVVAMAMDEFAGDDLVLEDALVEPTAADEQTLQTDTSEVNKENEHDLPEGCDDGAANAKVSNALIMP